MEGFNIPYNPIRSLIAEESGLVDGTTRDIKSCVMARVSRFPELPQENSRSTANVEQASCGTAMLSYIPKNINGIFPVKIRSVMLKVPDRTFARQESDCPGGRRPADSDPHRAESGWWLKPT